MSEALATEQQSEPRLTIERSFAQPPARVFAAWTDSAALRQWMGPGEVRAPDAEIDARVGGVYRIPMLLPDGGTATVRGTISELVPDRRLRFSWAWDQEDGSPGQVMDVIVEFHAEQGGTRMVLNQTRFIDAEARDKHEHGWSGSFDKLAQHLTARA